MCLAIDYQECFFLSECLISFDYTVKHCTVIGCHSVVAVGKCWCLLVFKNYFLKCVFTRVCLLSY